MARDFKESDQCRTIELLTQDPVILIGNDMAFHHIVPAVSINRVNAKQQTRQNLL